MLRAAVLSTICRVQNVIVCEGGHAENLWNTMKFFYFMLLLCPSWLSSFLAYLASVIFVLQLPFERYSRFFRMKIIFQCKKLGVAIWNFRNFFTVTVTVWVELLFFIPFLSAYLTIPYAKMSFTFCELYDTSGPKGRDSFLFYNRLVFSLH